MKFLVPAMGRVNTQNRDGSEVRFSHVARQWTARGHSLHLVLPEREAPILRQAGVEGTYHILREPFTSERDSTWNVGLLYAFRLLQVSASLPPDALDCDICYSPSDFLPDLYPAVVARRRKQSLRLAVCLFLLAPNPLRGYENAFSSDGRAPSLRSSLFYLLQEFGLVLLRRYADAVLVLNELDRRTLAQRGLADKTSVVRMGVDIPAIAALPGDAAQAFDAIFLGRLHAQKGVLDAVRAWEYVVRSHPNARLGIIGGGSAEWLRKLGAEIQARHLDQNVTVLGFKSGSERFLYLKAARCFLFPSHYESFGMAALEAMACGLPVVAYDLPIFPPLFPGGMLRAPIGDVRGLAEHVMAVLEDGALHERMALEAQQVAAGYDWPLVAQEELTLLEHLRE